MSLSLNCVRRETSVLTLIHAGGAEIGTDYAFSDALVPDRPYDLVAFYHLDIDTQACFGASCIFFREPKRVLMTSLDPDVSFLIVPEPSAGWWLELVIAVSRCPPPR